MNIPRTSWSTVRSHPRPAQIKSLGTELRVLCLPDAFVQSLWLFFFFFWHKGGLEALGQTLPEQGPQRVSFESRQTDSVYKGIGQPGHGGICLPYRHSGGRDAQMSSRPANGYTVRACLKNQTNNKQNQERLLQVAVWKCILSS